MWYILSNAEGTPNRRTRSASTVLIDSSMEDVDDFRAKILQVRASELAGLTTDRLMVYRTRSDLVSGSFIDPGLSINALGQSSEEALIVAVPEIERRRNSPGSVRMGIPEFADSGPIPGDLVPLDDVLSGRVKFVELRKGFLDDSGTGRAGGRNTLLLVRDSCRKQISYIRDQVFVGGNIGVIHGQPGTGKSLTTYYVLGTYAPEWRTTWIRVVTGSAAFDSLC